MKAHIIIVKTTFRRILLCGMLLVCRGAGAQVLSVRPANPMRSRPLLVLTGTLGVSASPGAVSFTLSPQALSAGSSSLAITTSWNTLTGSDIAINIYGYFSSTTAALTNTTNSAYVIPPSIIEGIVTGTGSTSTSYAWFAQTTPFSGASGLELASLNGGLIQFLQNGSTNNTLSLQIDLTTLPQLPAGTYTGVLNIAAQAM
jgi:hypothetical protein